MITMEQHKRVSLGVHQQMYLELIVALILEA